MSFVSAFWKSAKSGNPEKNHGNGFAAFSGEVRLVKSI